MLPRPVWLSRPARAFTVLEATLVLGLLVLTLTVLISRNVSVDTAGDDRGAQASITATLGELHAIARLDGEFEHDPVTLSERLPRYTFTTGGNVSKGPEMVSVRASGTSVGLAAVGGQGDCWLVMRDLDAATSDGRFVVAVSETATCTGDAALLLTPDPAGEQGTSFDTPLVE